MECKGERAQSAARGPSGGHSQRDCHIPACTLPCDRNNPAPTFDRRNWQALQVRILDGRIFRGWWRKRLWCGPWFRLGHHCHQPLCTPTEAPRNHRARPSVPLEAGSPSGAAARVQIESKGGLLPWQTATARRKNGIANIGAKGTKRQ